MISQEIARGLLEKKRDQATALKRGADHSTEFKKWFRDTTVAIEKIFGKAHARQFNQISFSLMAFSSSTPDSEFTKAFHEGLDTASAQVSPL